MTIIDFLASAHGLLPAMKERLFSVLHLIASYQGREVRNSGEPVLEHPCDVMHQLMSLGFPDEVILAAALHDLIEDTKENVKGLPRVTFMMLFELFGFKVAFMVWGVTKKDKELFVSKGDRLGEFHRRFLILVRLVFYIVFIKLADRLHNMRTLTALVEKDPSKVWRVSTETKAFYVPLARVWAKEFVPAKLHPALDEYAEELEELAEANLLRLRLIGYTPPV